jgi:hypothetical protein
MVHPSDQEAGRLAGRPNLTGTVLARGKVELASSQVAMAGDQPITTNPDGMDRINPERADRGGDCGGWPSDGSATHRTTLSPEPAVVCLIAPLCPHDQRRPQLGPAAVDAW